MAISIACAVVFAVLSGCLLAILQPAVNDLVVHPRRGALVTIPLTIVALAIGRGVAQAVQASLVNTIGAGVVGDIQLELFGKMVRADLARLRASHSGGFVSSVLYDAGLIREAATTGLVNFIQQGLTLAGRRRCDGPHGLETWTVRPPWRTGGDTRLAPISPSRGHGRQRSNASDFGAFERHHGGARRGAHRQDREPRGL